jgi:hypothetical protein
VQPVKSASAAQLPEAPQPKAPQPQPKSAPAKAAPKKAAAKQPEVQPVEQVAPAVAHIDRQPVAVVRIVPAMPAQDDFATWTLQAASDKTASQAQFDISCLRNAGLSPSIERWQSWYRIVIKDVPWENLGSTIQKIGQAGFGEVWIR